jgi:hypothetical protein
MIGLFLGWRILSLVVEYASVSGPLYHSSGRNALLAFWSIASDLSPADYHCSAIGSMIQRTTLKEANGVAIATPFYFLTISLSKEKTAFRRLFLFKQTVAFELFLRRCGDSACYRSRRSIAAVRCRARRSGCGILG